MVVAAVAVPALIGLLLVRGTPGPRATPHPRSEATATGLPLKEALAVLRQRSVVLMAVAAMTAGAFSLAIAWVPCAVVGLDEVDPDTAGIVLSAVTVVTIVYAVFSGTILQRMFAGRAHLYVGAGLALVAVGYLVAAVVPMNWLVWSSVALGVTGIGNAIFYGTLTTYFSMLVGTRATGTTIGCVTCVQTVGSFAITKLSADWFDTGRVGHEQIGPALLVGAGLFTVGAIAACASQRVVVHEQSKSSEPR